MEIPLELIKKLRDETGFGIIECKKALADSGGNSQKAKEILSKRGMEIAAKKSGREAKQGRIESYIHPGNKMATLVEVNCETDFVANSPDFCQFTKELALHIAAMGPKYIRESDIPAEVLEPQPDKKTFVKENCLLNQPYVKDQSKTIQDNLNTVVGKIGENIIISRFVRYKVGEIE